VQPHTTRTEQPHRSTPHSTTTAQHGMVTYVTCTQLSRTATLSTHSATTAPRTLTPMTCFTHTHASSGRLLPHGRLQPIS
jgi:hypothetical protein